MRLFPPVAAWALSELDCSNELDEVGVAKLHTGTVREALSRGYWNFLYDLILRSHAENDDRHFFEIRKGAQDLRQRADSLITRLNPLYGKPRLVSPAFHWAQSDELIQMTIKFTARWNTPGAVEVTDEVAKIDSKNFIYTAVGEHSNTLYNYTLELDFFDEILVDQSRWHSNSVGRLSATFVKKHVSVWPRLLVKSKKKNAHVWHEQQDKLQLPTDSVKESRVSCEPLNYCASSDSCLDSCGDCFGKHESLNFLCSGEPEKTAIQSLVNLYDEDIRFEHLKGLLQINFTHPTSNIDVDEIEVSWDSSPNEILFKIPLNQTGSSKISVETPELRIPEKNAKLTLVGANRFGKSSPKVVHVLDRTYPDEPVKQVEFLGLGDTDLRPSYLKTELKIHHSLRTTKINFYVVRRNRKLVLLEQQSVKGENEVYELEAKLPKDSMGVIQIFAANEDLEHPQPFELEYVDRFVPQRCLRSAKKDKSGEIRFVRRSREDEEKEKIDTIFVYTTGSHRNLLLQIRIGLDQSKEFTLPGQDVEVQCQNEYGISNVTNRVYLDKKVEL